MPLQVR